MGRVNDWWKNKPIPERDRRYNSETTGPPSTYKKDKPYRIQSRRVRNAYKIMGTWYCIYGYCWSYVRKADWHTIGRYATLKDAEKAFNVYTVRDEWYWRADDVRLQVLEDQ